MLRADGIALSHDGVVWFAGSGAYGKGWGNVGQGVSVATGATFYAKYYSEKPASAALHFAPHGTKWGSWHVFGPALSENVGRSATHPIILKFQNVGTPGSTVTWMNGSGSWSGFIFPGNYDLALGHDALWTLPPVTIAPSTPSRSWWRALFRVADATESDTSSVPDGGGTALLLGFALLAIASMWFALNRRRHRYRHPHSSDDLKP